MYRLTINLLPFAICAFLFAAADQASGGDSEQSPDNSGQSNSDQTDGWFRYRSQDGAMKVMQAHHGVAVRWSEGGAPQIGVLLAEKMPEAEHGRDKRDPINSIISKLPVGTPWLSLKLVDSGDGLRIRPLMLSPGGFMSVGDGNEKIHVDGDRLKGDWQVFNDDLPPGSFEADLHFDLELVELD